MTENVLIAGASGEVGKRVIAELLADNSITSIHALVRKPLDSNATSTDANKLFEHPLQPDDNRKLIPPKQIDTLSTAICTLGTTIKTAGSQSAFRAIDFDLVLNFAELAIQLGCKNFICISSLGAEPNSNNFYLKTKGEMEQALSKLPFNRVTILRPSLLTGGRKEFRLGEHLGAWAMLLVNPLLVGNLKKFRSIDMNLVARCIRVCTKANSGTHGIQVVESDEIRRIAIEEKN